LDAAAVKLFLKLVIGRHLIDIVIGVTIKDALSDTPESITKLQGMAALLRTFS